MTSRKDKLRAALTARERELPDGNSGPGAAPPPDKAMPTGEGVDPKSRPRPLVGSGAVGAMGRSLGRIAHAAEEARAMVAAGDRVIELDPALVESSFVADRLATSPEDHANLVSLIRERGQQVPILVRPHPEHPGRYQVAYGHRRLRAAADLGRPVRAVVKALTDEDLVVAQGQENSARADLSFIERARFAIALEDRGFDRSVIMAALSLEKTQLSRLIAIGRAVPAEVLSAIGPAPKAGRPRWSALVDALSRPNAPAILDRVIRGSEFQALDSDHRFARILGALTASARSNRRFRSTAWKNPGGKPVVRISQNMRQTQLIVDEGIEPNFGAFLIENLPQLYETFTARRGEGDSG
jgi:ParB family chromosome partitioning protein